MLSANFKPKNSCDIARFPCDSTAFLFLRMSSRVKPTQTSETVTLRFLMCSLYKFANCLISQGAEDVASEALKIDVFDYPTVVWPLVSKEPPEYPQKPYCQKLQSLRYIFVADSMGLCSFKFSWWWAPKDAFCFVTESVMAVQVQPRSLILAPIESAYATSYWSVVTNSKLGPILPRFRDIASCEERPTPIPPEF